jgi:UDPglucose 6-dehydrogenase
VIPKKVEMINNGISPIFENGLEELLKSLLQNKRIRATLDAKEVVLNSDIIFICTGTPSSDDGSIDLKYIESATIDIARALKETNDFKTIVVKSTVVPGTTTNFVKPLLEEHSGKTAGVDFGLGMNPEFLKEGLAIEDFRYPDHIVIGAIDDRSYTSIAKIYESFTCPIKKVNPSTAEMIKYATNAFLATKISFINEIANMSEKMGVDVDAVADGIGADQRISPKFLRPGVGFGGSCFPKDVKALAATAKLLGVNAHTLDTAISVNKLQPLRAVELLEEMMDVNNKKIALLGLAFKPETDDMREAPSIIIANNLLKKGAKVSGYDPIAKETAKMMMPNGVDFYDSVPEVLQDADAAILVTEWKEFHSLKSNDFNPMKSKIIVDGRRILNWRSLSDNGVKVKVLGNPN